MRYAGPVAIWAVILNLGTGLVLAIDIEGFVVGEQMVTITGITVPAVPDDDGFPTGKLSPTESWNVDSRGAAHLQHWHQEEDGTWSNDDLTVLKDLPTHDVYLAHSIGATDMAVVVDVINGEVVVRLSLPKTLQDPPAAAFTVEGFEPGSAQIMVSGLVPGSTVITTYLSPGFNPEVFQTIDGRDDDGEADGAITMGLPRVQGPPHVLPCDLLIVGTDQTVDGESPVAIYEADGLEVRYVVDVASHVIGATGVPFISDLALANGYGIAAEGWIRFVREGTSVDTAPEIPFTLAPGGSLSWADVLQSAFGITDNVKGTLLVGGFRTWSMMVSSRNYAVNEAGQRFGIALPGRPTFQVLSPRSVYMIPGLRDNENFRSNLIVAGAVPQDSTITVSLYVAGNIVGHDEFTVPGYGLFQVNRISQALGASTVEDGYLEIKVASGAVSAGLSVVDNTTDDAAYIVAQPVIQVR